MTLRLNIKIDFKWTQMECPNYNHSFWCTFEHGHFISQLGLGKEYKNTKIKFFASY